jgi:hypothetical protein
MEYLTEEAMPDIFLASILPFHRYVDMLSLTVQA